MQMKFYIKKNIYGNSGFLVQESVKISQKSFSIIPNRHKRVQNAELKKKKLGNKFNFSEKN